MLLCHSTIGNTPPWAAYTTGSPPASQALLRLGGWQCDLLAAGRLPLLVVPTGMTGSW
jgi:hypothetical protein